MSFEVNTMYMDTLESAFQNNNMIDRIKVICLIGRTGTGLGRISAKLEYIMENSKLNRYHVTSVLIKSDIMLIPQNSHDMHIWTENIEGHLITT